MDTTYSANRGNKNFKGPLLILVILLLLAGTGYFIFGRTGKLISPLPETPAVEIIFYTPTMEPVTPSASPSATPKAGKKPTATTAPKKEPTSVPSKAASASATKSP